MSYTLFAYTAALPPVISESTNCMTGKFVIHWANLQLSRKLFRHNRGFDCG